MMPRSLSLWSFVSGSHVWTHRLQSYTSGIISSLRSGHTVSDTVMIGLPITTAKSFRDY